MKWSILVPILVCAVVATNPASADMIRGIDIDFVAIGNAGNIADSTGYGAVGYDYSIAYMCHIQTVICYRLFEEALIDTFGSLHSQGVLHCIFQIWNS